MSSWNVRIMRHNDDDQIWYGVHEVHYDESGAVTSWTMNPVKVIGESVDDIRDYIEKCRVALEKPVLDYEFNPDPTMNRNL